MNSSAPNLVALASAFLLLCSGAACDAAGSGGDGGTGTDGLTTSTPMSTTSTTTNNTAVTTATGSGGNSTDPSTVGGSSVGDAGSSSASSNATLPGSSGGSSGTVGTGGSSTTSVVPTEPIECGNQVYACGDLEDNDGDGFIDLLDPECTGPCDDDETSFATGIPGDNVDCTQDCFFDGNSGQGEGCSWNLRCDPENPGADIGCEYNGGGPQCSGVNDNTECAKNCGPLTPPGCDCFGCCTVETPEGPIDIFLNGSEDCSLDNLDACMVCTSQIEDCGNPCEPNGCEICFGESELPEGCDEAECDNGASCEDGSDCGDFEYCYLNCCYPSPG